MVMQKNILFYPFMIIFLCGFHENSAAMDPDSLFSDRGEACFSVSIDHLKKLDEIGRIVSIDKITDTSIIINASKQELEAFLKTGIPFTLMDHSGDGFEPQMSSNADSDAPEAWDYYPTYDAYIAMMYQFEADHPSLCDVFTIGQSVNQRELLVARISGNIGAEENEPEFFYTSTMHGDELTGYVMMLRLIDHLLSNYGSDPRITEIVNNTDIFINPLANPDGAYAGGNHTVAGATRRNANWVDLNRNFPDPEDGPHPDGNPWQPETIAFMDFAENRHFSASSNIHGGAEVCNYPWDTWAKLAADDNWWVYVCNEFADTAQHYSPPGYLEDFGTGVTNGYQWYSISGGRQDYMNFFHQCREFTLEMSADKNPPESELNDFWEYTYRSFLNYLEQCRFGVRGTVTDTLTGDPLEASVYVVSHEKDSSWVYTSLPAGNYHRLLHEGAYNIKYSSPGYLPKVKYALQVVNRAATAVDVKLMPSALAADFEASKTSLSAGQDVDFTDLTYGSPVSWNWTFEGGTPASSTLENPSGIVYSEPGSYPVSLTVSDGNQTNTFEIMDYIEVSNQFFMGNGSVTTCSGVFYDSGGPEGNYSDFEDYAFTFYPEAVNGRISVNFTEFSVEYQGNCQYDWLKIYDGPDLNAPLIGIYCGTSSPGMIGSTHSSGALTFEFHSDYSVNQAGWAAEVQCEVEPVILDLTLFLEGPFAGGTMSTGLAGNPDFPLSQPYNTAPWFYQGTESVASVPSSVVDWLLVELRDATSASQALPSTSVGSVACFVLSNGMVKGMDGVSYPQVNAGFYDDLFCVIWHRNHLGAISAWPLTEAGGVYTYDFSSGSQQALGGSLGYSQLNGSLWGMSSGDGNADGQVNNGDKNDVWSPQAGMSGYLPGDFSMDAQVNNGDKVDHWAPNTGKGCQVPEN